MTTATPEILIGECECDTCGCTYDYEAVDAEYSDQCPACQAAEERKAAEAEAREEAIDEAQAELDEAESDVESIEAELAEARERLAEAKKAARQAHKRLEGLKAE